MYKLFLVGISFLLIQVIKAQDCKIELQGHVVDSDVKENIFKATVTIIELNKTVETDKWGDFSFSNLCKGEYTVRVTHVNCSPYEKKIVLEKNKHLDVNMPHSVNTLGEAVVIGQKERQNTGFKKELSGVALDATRGGSLGEALGKINGVTLLQTGATVSKPVVHGLFGSRLLMINNGVRQEGQQWGNEHAPEVDPFLAEKLIVLKGVDELKYGSDAIGGVIIVEPKLLRNDVGRNMEINTGYFTNNKQYYGSAIYEEQLKRLSSVTYRVQGTFKRGANSTTPNYRLNNTGLEECNFSGTLRFKKGKTNTELFYSNFNTKLGIFIGSHIGNLTDLANAIASEKPNEVFTNENTYKIERPRQEVNHQVFKLKSTIKWATQKLNILVSAQLNEREEYDIVKNSNKTTPQIALNINTFAQDVNWEHPKLKHITGTLGMNTTQQQNTYSGRYFIPNYTAFTAGGYVIEKWMKHQWELQAGARVDVKNIATTRLKFNGNLVNYDFKFTTFATSANAIYKFNNSLKTNLNVALSSRAPYVNELLSDGIHHGTATYERGNLFLKPEQSIYTSWNLNYASEKLSVEVLGYVNFIKNFIYQQPKPNEPVLTIAGAFPLIEYTQTNAALYGADIAGNISLSNKLMYNAKLSFLLARNRTSKDWLIWMPANRTTHEFNYTIGNYKKLINNNIIAEWTYVGQQRNTPSEANGKQDYAIAPQDYSLFNLGLNTTIQLNHFPITIYAGVQNVFNTAYRDYMNTFRYFTDELGRNISFKVKVPFNL
jgi:iron complex outermembrane recepter protein